MNYKDWYDKSIYKTYVNALMEWSGLDEQGIRDKATTSKIFEAKFTNDITDDYEKTKELYGKLDYFAFRNPYYWRDREEQTFNHYWINYQTNPGPVLDFGCGAGVLSEYLLRKGVKDLTVSDLSGKTWDFAKFFFGDRVKYEDNVENIKGMYQLIIANDVFEHLHYPLKVLDMFKEHLLPKGRLVINIAHDIGGPHLRETINNTGKINKRIREINNEAKN